jgi:hypothetical protein
MVDIYRVFHPTTRQYTFFSAAHGTFSKIDIKQRYFRTCSKSQQIQENQNNPLHCISQNGIKLGFKKKRNPRKYSNTWTLNNTLIKKNG